MDFPPRRISSGRCLSNAVASIVNGPISSGRCLSIAVASIVNHPQCLGGGGGRLTANGLPTENNILRAVPLQCCCVIVNHTHEHGWVPFRLSASGLLSWGHQLCLNINTIYNRLVHMILMFEFRAVPLNLFGGCYELVPLFRRRLADQGYNIKKNIGDGLRLLFHEYWIMEVPFYTIEVLVRPKTSNINFMSRYLLRPFESCIRRLLWTSTIVPS